MKRYVIKNVNDEYMRDFDKSPNKGDWTNDINNAFLYRTNFEGKEYDEYFGENHQCVEVEIVEKSQGCEMCKNGVFENYVPVSNDGDICEKSCETGEKWVYHANYCPNCGRKL